MSTSIRWPGAPLTSAQAIAAINALQPGLGNKIKEVAPPSEKSWCHSYTFGVVDKGLYGKYVDIILGHNGYGEVNRSPQFPDPVKVCDVVVYRDSSGNVLHTGVVTKVKNGVATQITSKWGPIGTYEHAPQDVPPSYMPQTGAIDYYHTNRTGKNVLKAK